MHAHGYQGLGRSCHFRLVRRVLDSGEHHCWLRRRDACTSGQSQNTTRLLIRQGPTVMRGQAVHRQLIAKKITEKDIDTAVERVGSSHVCRTKC